MSTSLLRPLALSVRLVVLRKYVRLLLRNSVLGAVRETILRGCCLFVARSGCCSVLIFFLPAILAPNSFGFFDPLSVFWGAAGVGLFVRLRDFLAGAGLFVLVLLRDFLGAVVGLFVRLRDFVDDAVGLFVRLRDFRGGVGLFVRLRSRLLRRIDCRESSRWSSSFRRLLRTSSRSSLRRASRRLVGGEIEEVVSIFRSLRTRLSP